MRCNLLLLFAVTIGFGLSTNANAQTSTTTNEGPMRGEMAAPPTDNLELEATLETVKLDIIIDEMEDAGFSLDIEEGFDEEWEEEFWVSTDADEVEALLIAPDDSDIMDFEEVVLPEELTEEMEDLIWEDPEAALAEADEEEAHVEDDLEGEFWENSDEQEDEDIALLDGFVDNDSWEEEDETDWWASESSGLDDSWSELEEEWELEELEYAYESDDIEYLEMMYGTD
jgi:hypothetical protein